MALQKINTSPILFIVGVLGASIMVEAVEPDKVARPHIHHEAHSVSNVNDLTYSISFTTAAASGDWRI